MGKEITTQEIEQDTYELIHNDGVQEVGIGILLIYLSALFYLSQYSAFFVLLAMIIPYQDEFIQKLKNKYTYPRIGYGQTKKIEKNTPQMKNSLLFGFLLSLFFIIIILFSYFSIYNVNWLSILPLIIGLALGLFMKSQYNKKRVRSYRVMGLIAIASGIIFSLIAMSNEITGIWYNGISSMIISFGLLVLGVGSYKIKKIVNKFPIIQIDDEMNEGEL